MSASVITAVVAAFVSGSMTIVVTVVMQKTRNVTQLDVANIDAETKDQISQREALQAEQTALNNERTRLDRVRDDLEKGRSVEIGNLKLRVNGLEETLVAERAEHARQLGALNARIVLLERQLLQANIEIVELQKERRQQA